MGTLPANVPGDIPAIGSISHVDTSPDFSGKHVNHRLVKTTAAVIALALAIGVVARHVPGAAPAAGPDADLPPPMVKRCWGRMIKRGSRRS